MRATAKKRANSAAVQIPAALMDAAKLKLGDAVDVREEGGLIIIEPVRQKRYELAELLARITSRSQHAVADFAPPVGKELFVMARFWRN
jgi:antitoxin MazE